MTDIELRISPDRNVIDQLVDQAFVLATEAQTRFAEQYGSYSWRADLGDDNPVFWFEREPEPAIFRPHFIGSTSGVSNTWLWGWDNINGFPDAAVEVVAQLRGIAEQLGDPELTTAKLPLESDAREAEGFPEHDEYSYVYAAMAVSGLKIPVFYRAPSGPEGSYAWFVLDNAAEFTLADATPIDMTGAITQALETGRLTDHRLAVESYAQRRSGVTLVEGDSADGGGSALTLSTASGDVTVTFDDENRVVRISGTARAQAEPLSAPRPAPAVEEKQAGFFGRLFGKKYG